MPINRERLIKLWCIHKIESIKKNKVFQHGIHFFKKEMDLPVLTQSCLQYIIKQQQ